MILYHGTSEENGLKIINDRIIKCNQVSVYDKIYKRNDLSETVSLKTSKDKVFFSDNPIVAYNFARVVIQGDYSKKACILKVNIDKEFLLPDLDEAEWGCYKPTSLDDSLEFLNSCSFFGDLKLNHGHYALIKNNIHDFMPFKNHIRRIKINLTKDEVDEYVSQKLNLFNSMCNWIEF